MPDIGPPDPKLVQRCRRFGMLASQRFLCYRQQPLQTRFRLAVAASRLIDVGKQGERRCHKGMLASQRFLFYRHRMTQKRLRLAVASHLSMVLGHIEGRQAHARGNLAASATVLTGPAKSSLTD
jgi:hypothetical protein